MSYKKQSVKKSERINNNKGDHWIEEKKNGSVTDDRDDTD